MYTREALSPFKAVRVCLLDAGHDIDAGNEIDAGHDIDAGKNSVKRARSDIDAGRKQLRWSIWCALLFSPSCRIDLAFTGVENTNAVSGRLISAQYGNTGKEKRKHIVSHQQLILMCF